MTDTDQAHPATATSPDNTASGAGQAIAQAWSRLRGEGDADAAIGQSADDDANDDAETIEDMAGDTPVFERGRTADLDAGYDDEIGMPASPGYEAGSLQASVDDGQYGMNHGHDDPATGQSDPDLMGAMGMGQPDTAHSHGGFDDEDEQGLPGNAGYDGDNGDPQSADGLSGTGARYRTGRADGAGDAAPSGEFDVGSGHANPDEPGFSNDEDTLIDDAALDLGGDRAGGGGIEMPPPSPGVDIPMPDDQPGYGNDGNDIEVEIPVPQESDIPSPMPNPPGQGIRT